MLFQNLTLLTILMVMLWTNQLSDSVTVLE